jgi:hypothetical protein
MAETRFTDLKALDAHIATLQKTRARGMPQAATWSRLREELERIVPTHRGESKSPPSVEGNSREQQVEAGSTLDQTAFWDGMRAEIETLRLRIRAEVEAYRSRNPAAGPYPPKQL